MPSRLNWPEQPVVGAHFTFALEHAYRDGRLVVVGCAEDLLALGGDCRVALDELGHHTAQRFDTQRQWGDVQQQNVLHVAREHAALDGGADGDDLVRVNALVWVFAKDLFDDLLHLGNPGRAADQHDFVDVAGLELRVFHGLENGAADALDQAVDQLFEIGSRDIHLQDASVRWHQL